VRTRSLFDRFAHWASHASGRPSAFVLAVAIVLAWLASGPVFKFSDTWQLVINTGTTIVTFLMVFLIQSTQNRDTVAIHIKLDELIRVTRHAHNALLDLEELNEKDLAQIRASYGRLAAQAREKLGEDFPRFGTSPGKDPSGRPIREHPEGER
jgi:low affinity Fe/Cu permease